jgi:hypothetical protein
MKTKPLEKYLFGAFVLLLVIFAGWAAHSDQGGVTEIYKNATAAFDDQVGAVSVIALPKDTVLVRTPYQGGRFWTESRKDKMQRFKCS